jgi:predicted dehydrogenase
MEFLKALGRRVRLGMVGGGFDSIIGETHRIAYSADGCYDLVAGAFSITPDVARETGRGLFVDEARVYLDWRDMVQKEAARDDGIDAVIIATPPGLHAVVAEAFLTAGVHVICEKPLTATLAEAERLKSVVQESGKIFVLTHCYSGFPMPRLARDLVKRGELGDIRMVEAVFAGGAAGVAEEPTDPAQRHWRFRPAGGREMILGEVGTHAYHLLRYITGMTPRSLSATMQTFAARREVFDNAYLTLQFENGGVGRLWASYMATGVQHGLSIKIFGSKASVEWNEENAEYLNFRPLRGPEVLMRSGQDDTSEFVAGSARFRPGHPEGYPLAFANIYRDAARAIVAAETGENAAKFLEGLPGIDDGVAGMRMIAAAAQSNNDHGVWTRI